MYELISRQQPRIGRSMSWKPNFLLQNYFAKINQLVICRKRPIIFRMGLKCLQLIKIYVIHNVYIYRHIDKGTSSQLTISLLSVKWKTKVVLLKQFWPMLLLLLLLLQWVTQLITTYNTSEVPTNNNITCCFSKARVQKEINNDMDQVFLILVSMTFSEL